MEAEAYILLGDKNVFRVTPLAPQVLGALRITGWNLKIMLQNGPFCLTFSKILSVIDYIKVCI